jgi:predicted MPP superfamily phosphohydrolase
VGPRWLVRLKRAFARPPFHDPLGRKGWMTPFARPQMHRITRMSLSLPQWPRWPRPLRVAFLSDFHVGSHSGDVKRMAGIVAEAAAFAPDLVLYGGDYMNMQPFGGGRVPPDTVADILAKLDAPSGRFAILGNHDIGYDGAAVTAALTSRGIVVIDDTRASFRYENDAIDILGIGDGHGLRAGPDKMIAQLAADRPTIVLAHDPVWFSLVRSPAHLTLSGHTHGGQVVLPGIGVVTNASPAPLRWSYGLVEEEGRTLYTTSGLGTSSIPLRIGVPPEFVIFDINGREAGS